MDALKGRRQLAAIITVRLAPIPLGVKNYGLGLTPGISSFNFSLGALAVNLPFSIMWAGLGSKATNLLEALDNVPEMGPAAKIGGALLMAAIAGGVLLMKFKARKDPAKAD